MCVAPRNTARTEYVYSTGQNPVRLVTHQHFRALQVSGSRWAINPLPCYLLLANGVRGWRTGLVEHLLPASPITRSTNLRARSGFLVCLSRLFSSSLTRNIFHPTWPGSKQSGTVGINVMRIRPAAGARATKGL